MSQSEEEKLRWLERLNLFHKAFQQSTDAIDNAKHVNGKVNVFMQEYPMFRH